ncbi:RNA interference and gene silencing protein [Penicillium sp. IBT 18751x]|nr:RNA interference and gene silencing protein [Penicillium sp. IBT 18751x]KAJ6117841.1 RNA interference and gene silencing protein [Penicillium sp. IBT 18751x]
MVNLHCDNPGTAFAIFNDADAASSPDINVHRIETAVSNSIAEESPEGVSFPPRPGYGTLGQPNILHTNYLSLTLNDRRLFCYNIHIEGTAPDQSVRAATAKQIVSRLLTEQLHLSPDEIVTDYHSLLFSCVEIPWARTYRVTNPGNASGICGYSLSSYKVYVSPTGTLSSREMMKYLNSTQHETNAPLLRQFMKALEVILGHFFSKEADPVRTVTQPNDAQFNLNKSPPFGFDWNFKDHLTIRAHAAAARVLFNAKIRHPPWRQLGPLSTMIKAYKSDRTTQAAHLATFLRGIQIQVTPSVQNYHGLRRRTGIEIIKGLAAPSDGAQLRHPPKVARLGAGPHEVEVFLDARQTLRAVPSPQGKYVTLVSYFEKEFHINLDLDLPVVNVGTPEIPLYFPAEVCIVQTRRSLSAKPSSAQRHRLVIPPEIEVAGTKKTLAKFGLQSTLNSTLSAFGIEVSPEFVTVYSRVLTTPRVIYARGVPARVVQASWSLNTSRLIRTVARRAWSWLYIDSLHSDLLDITPTGFAKSLKQLAIVLRRMGIFTSGSVPGRIIRCAENPTKAWMDDALSFLQAKNRPSIILVILSAGAKYLGNLTRLACDVTYGMPAVEVTDEWLASADQERYASIGLKMNLKLGGENHTVGLSDLGLFANGRTMIVGINVAFAESASRGSSHSIVGLVASANSQFTQWPVEICLQPGKDSRIHRLDEMLGTRIRAWAKDHGNAPPDDIVIYRSMGLEAGHGSWVDQELSLIKDACRASGLTRRAPDDRPRITVVLVDETHDARFFPTADTESYRYNSPPGGTVVDRGISDPRQWDFFLQPQSPKESNSRPTRYLVIYDEVLRGRCQAESKRKGPVDLLQEITYRLCYLSGEATKARNVCAPVYYAKQACGRVRSYYDPANAHGLWSKEHGARKFGAGMTDSLLQVHPNVQESMFYI